MLRSIPCHQVFLLPPAHACCYLTLTFSGVFARNPLGCCQRFPRPVLPSHIISLKVQLITGEDRRCANSFFLILVFSFWDWSLLYISNWSGTWSSGLQLAAILLPLCWDQSLAFTTQAWLLLSLWNELGKWRFRLFSAVAVLVNVTLRFHWCLFY